MAWRGRKDVHSGTLCRDTTRGDGGRAEPPGGGEALWRSSEHHHEDASVFSSAGLSAARDVRSLEPSPGACAGGFWPGGRLYQGQEGPLSLLLRGSAALGRLLRQGLSSRDGGSLLRWSCGGVRFFRRRATVDFV